MGGIRGMEIVRAVTEVLENGEFWCKTVVINSSQFDGAGLVIKAELIQRRVLAPAT